MQALGIPWLTALLYIFIFGSVVGKRIPLIEGYSYIDFVLPGIVMMNIINSAFNHASYSLYIQRFMRDIEEVLTAPFSHMEMLIGYVTGATVRALMVGMGIYALGLLFTAATPRHVGLFLLYAIGVSVLFSVLGLYLGLHADSFDHLSIVNFVIMPLTFLGGVFNSLHMLPPTLQKLVRLNPFFYFVDGFRYSMIGVHELPIGIGLTLLIILIMIACIGIWYLFKIGWKLRN